MVLIFFQLDFAKFYIYIYINFYVVTRKRYVDPSLKCKFPALLRRLAYF